jgi:hypothetical protein
MSLSKRNLNFLGEFIRSKCGLSLLKMVCLFGATSLCASGELARAELQAHLAQIEQRDADIRFHLSKDLLALQLQSYRLSGGNVEALAAAVRIATTEAEQRQECLNTLNVEEKEIFASYDTLLNLAHRCCQ